MSRHLAIAPADAIQEIVFQLSYAGGTLPLYVDGLPNPAHVLGHDVRLGERVAAIARRLDYSESREVAIGLPTTAEYVYRSTVLWAWVKGSDQARRAAAFTPPPSIVLRIGSSSERLLLWALRNPIGEGSATLFNERISYALRAPRTRSPVEKLRVPLPGTFMRVDRSVPAPVLVTRMKCVKGLDAEQIVARLKDPPPKDAWRERKR